MTRRCWRIVFVIDFILIIVVVFIVASALGQGGAGWVGGHLEFDFLLQSIRLVGHGNDHTPRLICLSLKGAFALPPDLLQVFPPHVFPRFQRLFVLGVYFGLEFHHGSLEKVGGAALIFFSLKAYIFPVFVGIVQWGVVGMGQQLLDAKQDFWQTDARIPAVDEKVNGKKRENAQIKLM